MNLGRVLEIFFGLHLSGLNAWETPLKTLLLSPLYLLVETDALFQGYAVHKQFFQNQILASETEGNGLA